MICNKKNMIINLMDSLIHKMFSKIFIEAKVMISNQFIKDW